MDWIFLFQTSAFPAMICIGFDSKQSIPTQFCFYENVAKVLLSFCMGVKTKLGSSASVLSFVWLD